MSAPLTIELSDELLEQIAQRAAELAAAKAPAPCERLLTVDELAELLATSTTWVRRHQAQLGAFVLSEGGGRNPVRFRASEVERFLAERQLRPPAATSSGTWRDDPDWALG